ncbi:MAG: hypothetical protein WEE89_22030 [Gemmatimonadota bacterium]
MALQEAIDAYHGLLTDDLAEETSAQLTAQLKQRGLFFGERPLCSVLRPRFLTAQQYRMLQERGRVLLGAFAKIHQAALLDDSFRRQFGLLVWEEMLVVENPRFVDPSPLSRLDAFFVPERGGLRFTEYNAETPAGASYNDVLAELFLGLPVMREFVKRYELRSQPTRHMVMHALLNAYGEWSGTRAAPRIAILDWRDVPTYSEFVLTQDYFRSHGLDCIIGDPHEAEYRDGALFISGQPIDLIYKRVLINELIERGGVDHPVVRAVRENAVCMVNPFRCKILHKKLSLAVLSDEKNRGLFTADELDAIDAHIPWTRRVEDRRTEYGGKPVELLEFAEQHRDQLVLKPNDDYGGRGIVLGWETSPEQWTTALEAATREPFIVQERIEIPTEQFPVFAHGHVQIEDRILDTAPYAFYGGFVDGCLTRLSTESLVNVTAGGGSSVATFIVAPRWGGGARARATRGGAARRKSEERRATSYLGARARAGETTLIMHRTAHICDALTQCGPADAVARRSSLIAPRSSPASTRRVRP